MHEAIHRNYGSTGALSFSLNYGPYNLACFPNMFNVKGNAGGSACISEVHAGCLYQLQLLWLKTDFI
jgi:hypothetical protein